MKSHARVVVIGGGIVGCSVLYHLTKLGWRDVVLVEKDELTAGSTWHAAGNTPYFSLSYNLSKLHAYSIDLYQKLEAETGKPVGFHRTGSVRLATTRDRMDEYRHYSGLARGVGIPHELIGPREIEALYPFMSMEGVLGAVWHPDDGHIAPADVTQALAKGARDGGAEIHRQTPVVGIERAPNGAWRVTTDKGVITAEIVVNASGSWGREIAAMVGQYLPTIPVEHQYLVTEDIPQIVERDEELPILRDTDAAYYVRQERNGLILGPYEIDPRPWAVDGVPPGFGQELLQPDVDRLQEHIDAAMTRVPILAEVGIKEVVNGPIPYTPDGNPLIGPAFDLRNFYHATGFSFGIIQGGGAGRYLAEWIVEGQPSIDLLEVDPRRFGAFANQAYVLAKVREVYQHEYAIGYPFEERPAGRPAKTSPIHDRLAARGAVFGARYGWERANWFAPEGVEPADRLSFRRTNWFEPVGAECRAVRERVGLLDLTGFAKYEVSGPGAEAFLDRIVANRLPREGRIALAHALTPKGGIECEFTITRLAPDRFYIITASAAELHDLDWLQRRLPEDGGVVIDNVTNRYGVLVLAGPRARQVLARLTDADLSSAAFPWLSAREITVGLAPVRALRVNYVGELGWELHHPIEYQRGLFDALMEAGAAFDIVPFGLRAMESLRLEKAYRMWGLELTTEYTPFEAGLDRFVRLNKAEFIGRDALITQQQEGIARRLVCLVVEADDADAIGNEPVLSGDRVVGYVTSGGFGYVVGASIALAYVPAALAEPGTDLTLEILGERRPARVVQEPLFDPENQRLKG